MKLVIDISEDDYRKAKDGRASVSMMRKAIRNGKTLPEGHGRLIDACALPLNAIDDANHGSNYIKIAPTIIEADKKYEDEVITRGKCMICGKELTEGLFFCKECGDKANSRK